MSHRLWHFPVSHRIAAMQQSHRIASPERDVTKRWHRPVSHRPVTHRPRDTSRSLCDLRVSLRHIAIETKVLHLCHTFHRLASHRPVPHRRNSLQNRIASHRRNVFVPSHRIAPSRDNVTVPSHRPVPCQRVVPSYSIGVSCSKAMENAVPKLTSPQNNCIWPCMYGCTFL